MDSLLNFAIERTKETEKLFEIIVCNEYGHIIDNMYTTNDNERENNETGKRLTKLNHGSYYRILRIK